MNDLVDLIDGGVDFFRIRPDGIDDDWIATILDQLPIAQRMRPMSTFGVMLETTGPMLRVHRRTRQQQLRVRRGSQRRWLRCSGKRARR